MRSLDENTIKDVEKNWVYRNKPYLAGESRTPSTVAMAYIADTAGMCEEIIDAELDWNYFDEWPSDDPIRDE